MSKARKGNPRCEACEGRGIVRAPRGYVVCTCVRGKPNEKVVAELAAVKLPDFLTFCDEYDQLRSQGVSHDDASRTAHDRSLDDDCIARAQARSRDNHGLPIADADCVPAYRDTVPSGMSGTQLLLFTAGTE